MHRLTYFAEKSFQLSAKLQNHWDDFYKITTKFRNLFDMKNLKYFLIGIIISKSYTSWTQVIFCFTSSLEFLWNCCELSLSDLNVWFSMCNSRYIYVLNFDEFSNLCRYASGGVNIRYIRYHDALLNVQSQSIYKYFE